jgi:hypothetical protein
VAGATNASVHWKVGMERLSNGVPVPVASGPNRSGRWQVRVRAAGAVPGAWSEPVAFDYIAPGRHDQALARPASELDRRGLNPQPLPPRVASELDRRGLNPQPLPPKEAMRGRSAFER